MKVLVELRSNFQRTTRQRSLTPLLYHTSSIVLSTRQITDLQKQRDEIILRYRENLRKTEANVQRGEIYAVFSDHWVETTFISGGYYYDPYGLSYNFAEGGDPYYGFQVYQPAYIYQEWVYMGQTGVIVALPNIIQMSPTAGIPGTNILVQIEGKYIGEHTGQFPTVSVSGGGVTAQVQNITPTGVEAIFQIAENADIGDHNVSLTSDGVPSNTVVFRVGDLSPVITSITPPEGNTGESVQVTISGSNFGVNPQVQVDGTGVQPTVISATANQINATFSIADLTYFGNRNVTIKSNGYRGTGFILAPGISDTSNAVQFGVFTPVVQIDDVPIIEKNGARTINVGISGLAQPTDKVKFTLKPLSGSGVAKFDNGSDVIQLSNGQSQPVKIRGITESSQANNMTIEATPVNASNVLAHKEFTVAVITSLDFERINGDDIALDDNPGTDGTHTPDEGLRIFPDKSDPNNNTGSSDYGEYASYYLGNYYLYQTQDVERARVEFNKIKSSKNPILAKEAITALRNSEKKLSLKPKD